MHILQSEISPKRRTETEMCKKSYNFKSSFKRDSKDFGIICPLKNAMVIRYRNWDTINYLL
jgi:hypothetical protein